MICVSVTLNSLAGGRLAKIAAPWRPHDRVRAFAGGYTAVHEITPLLDAVRRQR